MMIQKSILFQSTRLREARPRNMFSLIGIYSFNPRAYVRRDSNLYLFGSSF